MSQADTVNTHGPLPTPAVVRSLAAGVLDALIAVHAGGLVHRDLKPSYVLLTTDGVQVIYFGIAAAAEGTALTATGTHLGSRGPRWFRSKPSAAPSGRPPTCS